MIDLISTGTAATILGCSRQHVVDLCDQGVLPSMSPGLHRRLRRKDVEAFASVRSRGDLTTDQTRSLWVHRAVAGRLAQDPDRAMGIARSNIERAMQRGPSAGSSRWLRRWEELLVAGPESVMDMLTSRTPDALELRQNSPFAGVLSEQERLAVLKAYSAQRRA